MTAAVQSTVIRGEWVKEQRGQGLWRIAYVELKPLTAPDERSKVGEVEKGEAMATGGVGASAAAAPALDPLTSVP